MHDSTGAVRFFLDTCQRRFISPLSAHRFSPSQMSDQPFVNLDEIDFGSTLRGHLPGDRLFGRFVLKRLLGRGGMGVVWLAHDERLEREVALKFAPDAVRFDDAAIEELKSETRRGLELAHPNIVKI